MPELALALYALYLLLAFGMRSLLQWRRTGHSGFVGLRGRVGSAEWLGGVLFAVAVVAGAAAPALELAGTVEPVAALERFSVRLTGTVVAVIGIIATVVGQLAMGTAWRIGVNPQERTELVTDGLFAVVRNPIFAAMIPVSIGLALLTPNWLALGGVLTLTAALQIQTRLVEEPYLRRVHGERYRSYTANVGRFMPRIGRIAEPSAEAQTI